MAYLRILGAGFMVPIFTLLVHSQVSCDVCLLCSRCWTHGTNLYPAGTQSSILRCLLFMFQVLDSWYQCLPRWYTVKYLVMFVSYVPSAGLTVPIFTWLVHSQVSCDVCFLCSKCWTHGTNLYLACTQSSIL